MGDNNQQFNVEDILKELKAARQSAEIKPAPQINRDEQSRVFDKTVRPQASQELQNQLQKLSQRNNRPAQNQMGDSRQPTREKNAPAQREMGRANRTRDNRMHDESGRASESAQRVRPKKSFRTPNVLTPEEILGINKPQPARGGTENISRGKPRKKDEQIMASDIVKIREIKAREDLARTMKARENARKEQEIHAIKAREREDRQAQETALRERAKHGRLGPRGFGGSEDFDDETGWLKKQKSAPVKNVSEDNFADVFGGKAKKSRESGKKPVSAAPDLNAKIMASALAQKMTKPKKPIDLSQGKKIEIENKSLHKSPDEMLNVRDKKFATKRINLFTKTREIEPIKPKIAAPQEQFADNDIYSGGGLTGGMKVTKAVDDLMDETPRKKRAKKFVAVIPSDEISLISPEKEFAGDYERAGDAVSVHMDLSSAKNKLTVRAIITFIILMLSTATALFKDISVETLGLNGFVWFNIIALVAVGLINVKTSVAFVRIFKGKADSECVISILLVLGLMHTLAVMQAATYTSAGQIYAAPIILAVLVFVLSQLYYVSKTLEDFEVIANDKTKSAGMVVNREDVALKLSGDDIIGEPMVLCQRKSVNIKGFLKNSFSKSPCDKLSATAILCGLILAAAIGLSALIMTQSALVAISAALVIILAATPIGAIIGAARILTAVGRETRKYEAVIVGHEGVRQLSEVNSVVLNSEDLFPVGCAQIRGIKCFNGESEDKAIVTAAALALKFGGTLGHLFDATTMGNHELLPAVANVKYENLLGISGFVGEAEAKLGIRAMMEENAIKIPPVEIEKQLNARGARLLYLSVGVNLAAIFILNYETNEEIRENLYEMAKSGVLISVYTKDPILTENMVGACFRLPKGSVRILDESAGQTYKEATADREDFESVAINVGNTAGMCENVKSAFLVSSATRTIAVLQVVAIILAVVFAGYSVLGGGNSVLVGQALLYQVITFGVCYLATWFFKR